MKRFDDENPTGFESSLKSIRHSTASHITQQDQVPAALSKVKVFHARDFGLEVHSELARVLPGESNRFLRRVKPGDIPALLRQPDTVAALPHSHIQSRSRLAVLDHLHQECIRLGVEARLRRGEDLIPALHFGARALFIDKFQLGLGVGIGEPARFEIRAIERLHLVGLVLFRWERIYPKPESFPGPLARAGGWRYPFQPGPQSAPMLGSSRTGRLTQPTK